METKLLTEKYADSREGVLNCYDRLIIIGSLHPHTGLLDRITFHAPFTPGEAPRWRTMVKAFKQ